jgi:PHD/YefM family antitoxin component YafN of YafNO toxin-antitoxin module
MMKHQDGYSTSDFSERSVQIVADALRRHVTITHRRKPDLVMMSREHFTQLSRRADPRRAIRIQDMNDKLFEAMKAAVNALEDDLRD